MSSLFDDYSNNEVSLLDPGAGVGSLTAAFVEEFMNRRIRPSKLSVTAYEIEPLMLDYLESTMKNCELSCSNVGTSMYSHIETGDFIEECSEIVSGDLLAAGRFAHGVYSHVIVNPLYKKIPSFQR